ncbi:MAG TPA: flagellar basal body L-ring protein FlgH [Caldithrix abyssi]|uniref:Flagellar basal body L-ring protein FlgH n=1 Tax=Caldithrix abyssi TaxID=187145 RepID=A0A7V5H1J0_CALAY|nr:flagellar basal body L-ring protein FlgH [Caldithrix abyssi]
MKIIILIFGLIACSMAQAIPSLYSDIKAHQVGDVLSVIIVENANASRQSKSNSKLSSEIGMDAKSSGNIADFLPVFGGSGSFNSKHQGEDGTAQSDRLTGRISVRIVEQTENGMLKIQGERKLNVNGEENLMKLEGFVRPRDITSSNTVYSYNIADARITYRKSGLGQSFLKTRTITKVLSFALAGLMVAASTGYFVFK